MIFIVLLSIDWNFTQEAADPSAGFLLSGMDKLQGLIFKYISGLPMRMHVIFLFIERLNMSITCEQQSKFVQMSWNNQ